ncbi:MAG: DUF3343 domain-containing protein [Dehalococcoidia bacterium]|nr:MAG: DUF3343 domain-containing protein [Dehalococcoidia bacterium]
MEATKQKKANFVGDGIIIFHDVAGAMKGERTVRAAAYEVKLVAPPPELRMGCDLALEINLVEQAGIERLFKEKSVPFVSIMPLKKNASQMCDIVKVTDFGKWVMVKAGNMKLSFEKGSGLIVNVSGGGCPDIPYLNAEMVDKPLASAPHPNVLGYTLCATMLQRAYEEALSIYNGGGVS